GAGGTPLYACGTFRPVDYQHVLARRNFAHSREHVVSVDFRRGGGEPAGPGILLGGLFRVRASVGSGRGGVQLGIEGASDRSERRDLRSAGSVRSVLSGVANFHAGAAIHFLFYGADSGSDIYRAVVSGAVPERGERFERAGSGGDG